MRDPIVGPTRRHLSPTTSATALYLAQVIAQSSEPTKTELDSLERAYTSTADFLRDCWELEGLFEQIHAHGSRQLGTLTRAVDPAREGCDIDLAVRLRASARNRFTPAQLLEQLAAALTRYAGQHGLKIRVWERCVTLTYAVGMTVDFAPIVDDPNPLALHGQLHARIPDRERQRYLPTNPRGYCLMFEHAAKIPARFYLRETIAKAYTAIRSAEILPLPDADEVFDRLLCRIVQATKIHRNVAFAGSDYRRRARPSSIFVTTLLMKAYELEAPKVHDSPLDLLLDMVESMPMLIDRTLVLANKSEIWKLPNPTAPGDDLAASMNDREKQMAFLEWHADLRSDLRQLLDAIEDGAGLDTILKIIESSFGERARAAVEEYARTSREAVRNAGRAAGLVGGAISLSGTARAHTHFGGA